jgi:hypothetical protein
MVFFGEGVLFGVWSRHDARIRTKATGNGCSGDNNAPARYLYEWAERSLYTIELE